MEEIKIEKGIALPIRRWHLAMICMAKNESFIFPVKSYSSIREAMCQLKDKRFRTVKISKTERRIWRIK